MTEFARSTFLLLVLGLCLPMAHAAVNTRSVETTRTIAATPRAVLDAFLDDADLKAWWKVSRSLVEPQRGGPWSITWDNWGEDKTQHAWIGTIEEISPDRLLIGSLVMIEPDLPLFGPMQLEIRVEPTTNGHTLLTVVHSGYRYGEHWDAIYTAVVAGWDHVLGDMQAWFMDEY
jgi:uncharacterized protein YndB with AHSA1/START domain